jgi:hypothetical protein
MIRSRELGKIIVDAGDIVCFSIDDLMRLAEKLGVSEETLIQRYNGVKCGFGADGNYGVDSLTAVNVDGGTYSVVMLGGDPEKFLRFLGKDDPTFTEFYKAHERYLEVGTGDQFNQDVFDLIAAEYKAKLVAAQPT